MHSHYPERGEHHPPVVRIHGDMSKAMAKIARITVNYELSRITVNYELSRITVNYELSRITVNYEL